MAFQVQVIKKVANQDVLNTTPDFQILCSSKKCGFGSCAFKAICNTPYVMTL